jgi:hypothetical protein
MLLEYLKNTAPRLMSKTDTRHRQELIDYDRPERPNSRPPCPALWLTVPGTKRELVVYRHVSRKQPAAIVGMGCFWTVGYLHHQRAVMVVVLEGGSGCAGGDVGKLDGNGLAVAFGQSGRDTFVFGFGEVRDGGHGVLHAPSCRA